MDPARVFTVGHSTRPIEEFTGLLTREGVTHLADVRAFPFSRRYPHFNGEQLSAAVAELGIAYTHFAELGGRRSTRPDSKNTAWKNASFRGYADYMETPEFKRALDSLMRSAVEKGPTAIMCAEAVPWRCHRSLISDALTARGVEVLHIMDGGIKPHTLTPFGRVVGDTVVYDSPDEPDLFST